MAVRRTKEEKQKARLRRVETHSYTFEATSNTSTPKVSRASKPTVKMHESDLFEYDLGLIKKDLIRTALATVVVFGILVALHFRL